ncbi:MAG: hypothetical protein KGI10_08810 [Thaumarchaeota archaeon]|nr:hypothetical protein [Nitrososphaerota archaeon]
MKILYLIILGIVTILGTSITFSQSSSAQMQNVTSPGYFKCVDSMEQIAKAKYASFDEERAKTTSISYDKFQSEVKNDNYTFVAISAEWKNDQVNCDVTFEHALVRFNVFNASGIQRDVTVIVNPTSYQPTSIVVEHDMPTHGGIVILSPLKQLHSGIKVEDVQCNQGFRLILKYSGDSSACIKNEDVLHFVERSWAKITVTVVDLDVRQ